MGDKELVELAGKAAGYPINQGRFEHGLWVYVDGSGEPPEDSSWVDVWDPLGDDGDALRLAVKLGLFVDTYDAEILVGWVVDKDSMSMETLDQPKGNDPYAATRRAIVRAAAEIGKTMGEQA